MITIKNYQKAPEIPAGVQKLLDSCPPAGQGVHRHLFITAKALQGYVDRGRAFERLLDMAVKAGRKHDVFTLVEIESSLENAWGAPSDTQPKQSVADVEPDLEAIDRIVTSFYQGSRSPDKEMMGKLGAWQHRRSGENGTWAFLEQLFPGNPWICMGTGKTQHDCKRLSDWRKQSPVWEFIVPTPQLARTGKTRTGKESTHALSNCDGRKYLVVEFDFKAASRSGGPTIWTPLIEHWEDLGVSVTNAQVALLAYISRRVKPVMVVDSGNVSVHAWFATNGISEQHLTYDIAQLVALGADPAPLRTRSQFVRTPNAIRPDTGRRQQVLAFNLEGRAE
jgi:hypothetical protein